ncbi:hypothetical protein IEQ34_004668 [Dendrobium chrysotoxum]|uniref:Uncharacterized protein n=1 Tax=Dendrobium chrysotoxum TaxID=161865 RepID=A0AAV7H028_DENCH|nr:hypothetical protein IEQ34_004668 [Dendrobium chrysotoxum]
MEGLIPLLLHATKKKRMRLSYRCLSEESAGGKSSMPPMVDQVWPAPEQRASSRNPRNQFKLPSEMARTELHSSDPPRNLEA